MSLSLGGERIFTAIDFKDLPSARPVIRALRHKTRFKVGMRLLFREGPPSVIREVGEDNFYDVKIHDIPNTVAGAVESMAHHKVGMINVHCLGGEKMMREAADTARKIYDKTGTRPKIIGVTILTSHDRDSLDQIGINPTLPMEQVVCQLAQLAEQAGLDGVVCSPQEIQMVRDATENSGFLIVTPGIRRKSDPADDQKRTLTAGEAIRLGADYLVIGRPIINADNPAAAADEFISEVEEALAQR